MHEPRTLDSGLRPLVYCIDPPRQVHPLRMPRELYAEIQPTARCCLLCGAAADRLYGMRERTADLVLGLVLSREVRERFTNDHLMYFFGGCAPCRRRPLFVKTALETLARMLRDSDGLEAHGQIALVQLG